MRSLANIPEPTTAYRPVDESPVKQATVQTLGLASDETAHARPAKPAANTEDEPQQQIDAVSCLLLLLIAGGLLRGVLGLFGPLQGIDAKAMQSLVTQGKSAFSDQPVDAFPLPGLLAAGVYESGAPGWLLIMLGSLLTLAAVPAAFVIGRAATGRRAAGVLAAALLAVHPAVLTAANTLSGTAIALGLLTIGLAMSLHAAKRGLWYAVGGGVMLGLAGLSAPLLWIPAALAGPFAGHVALQHGRRKAIAYALTVFVLALGPVLTYRIVMFEPTRDALLAEFSADQPYPGSDRAPGDRLLISLIDPSLAELGDALRLPIGDAGKLAANAITIDARRTTKPDPVADILADGWLLMNAALAALATVSIGVMLARRRYIETAVLAAPLCALGFASTTPDEMLRLPMLALLGVLAAGLLANKPVVVVDEEALAQRAARKAAKLAMKEEKERARQEQELNKYKGKLHAFDKPTRSEKKRLARLKKQQAQPKQPTGILTEQIAEDSSVPMRPI